jgi:hypothetical protein
MEKEGFALNTIGIMGTQRGVGVTHLAIMLGNYINAKLNKSVAILELNHTLAFEELRGGYVDKHQENHGFSSFSISGVTYYHEVEKDLLGMIYSQKLDYLVIDYGETEIGHTQEFLKCNIKIVVGNLNPWNSSRLVWYMESFIAMDYMEKIKYVTKFGTYGDVRQIRNIYKTNISAAPFEPDPFLIHGCNFEFLDKLLL